MFSNSPKKFLTLKATLRGVIAAICGSFLFVFGDVLAYLIHYGIQDVEGDLLLVIVVIFLGCVLVSVLPAILGGIWLAFELYQESSVRPLVARKTFAKGAILGFLIGLGLCIVTVGLYFQRGDWRILLFQSVVGLVLTSGLAGYTAIGLMKDISKLTS